MEFTAEKVQEHIAYCGSKTKECPECFSTVQAWMMNSHKETGECANIVLDRQEAEDQNQLKQAMEQSAFAADPQPSSVPQQHPQPSASQPAADTMDADQREIARLLQEDANAMESGNMMGGASNQYQQRQQPGGVDDGGIRAPDESRF